MELKYKKMISAFGEIGQEHNISIDLIKEALCEAMAKAYKKEAGIDDIDVYAQINEKKKTIDLFQNYRVVENVEDDELEISLEDARKIDKTAELGSVISQPVEIDSFSRASAGLTRNVIRQKIREAEKEAIYNEYIGQLNEMVVGKVESVKDKFALIDIGRTLAVLPSSQQIPVDGGKEHLTEGQILRVVITEVNKDSKGSQVLVSRTSEMLVKRLFEKDVPEVFSGEVVIKAIARDAGERTKMAVMSRNPDVDAIGACIGPNGQRVKGITAELKNEKIDIFEWSDDITELVKNALAPATIEAVLPAEDGKGLIVVVAEDQLSLAIGKKGKNARLAVKLTNHKIDIKTRADLEEAGMDYEALLAEAEKKHSEYMKEVAKKQVERMEAAAKEDEEKRAAALASIEAKKQALQSDVQLEEEGFIPEEMQDAMSDKIAMDIAMSEPNEDEPEEVEEEMASEEAAPQEVVEVEEKQEEEPVEEPMEDKTVSAKRKHADLEEMAEKNTYVSRFEKLTDAPKAKTDFKPKRKKKKLDSEDNYKVDNKELEKQIKEKLAKTDDKPLYTEEELEEIEAQRQAEEDRELGIDDDYDDDEYDEYYDDED